MCIIIGIGEYAISDRPADSIKTFALGSCVAVAFYAPQRKVLAMAHVVLPDSALNVRKGFFKPGYFANTAVSFLLHKLTAYYRCTARELEIKLYGGCCTPCEMVASCVGTRNILAIKQALDLYQLQPVEGAVGGSCSRTVEIAVATGAVQLTSLPLKAGLQTIK
jgi:chemotaxis protein CheD